MKDRGLIVAYASVTYTFSNSTTADATQVNQNFNDIINGLSDGTKDLSVSAITAAGNVTFNGNTTVGNASSDDFTLTASLASSVPIKTHNSFDIGSVTSKGLRAIYFASSSATQTAKVQGPAISSDITLTLPTRTGTFALNDVPTIQKFTSGSGTYTTPTGVRWIRLIMVGGGGGGAGSANAANDGGSGTNGNNSTFGSNTASGGSRGTGSAATGGVANGGQGGGATLASGFNGIAMEGNRGGSSGTANSVGGMGGAGPHGGSGLGGPSGAGGVAAIANSGSGGGGAGAPSAGTSGAGGGSGGYIDAINTSPAATYSYAVGASAAGGAAGSGGSAGTAGGSGVIIVEEYY